ncbi:MAG TPA: hypothetical protein VF761_16005 [Gemmatimonadaceae bacterium]
MLSIAKAALLSSVALLSASTLDAQAGGGGINLHVPDSVGVFARTERKDFDDPSLGSMFRYTRADGMRVDVFVYPGPDLATDCPTDCAVKLLDAEVANFVSAFPEMIKRGYTDSIAVVTSRTLTPEPADRWRMGRYLRLRMVTKGVVQSSDFYLYYLPDIRVKLRASYPVDSANAIAVGDFARRVIPAFVMTPAVASADRAEEKHVEIGVTLAGSPSQLFTQLVAALGRQGYTIADSSRAEGRIVTAPFMGWPKGSEKEVWHGKDSPGVVITVALTPKGDSTAVEIRGRSPAVAGWKDADVASQLELISVVMVAGELPKSKSH